MGLINLLTDLEAFYEINPSSLKYKGESQYATPPPIIYKGKLDQKSLAYGNDRPGGGSSNQPYIVTPIPDELTPATPDFVLRQGELAAASTDLVRITKFLNDDSSFAGANFIIKQNILELQSVKVPGGLVRAYNPANTLAQVVGLPTGLHLNKQGLVGFTPGYAIGGGVGGYFKFTLDNEIEHAIDDTEQYNRLVSLYTYKIGNKDLSFLGSLSSKFDISNDPNSSIGYTGGPDSVGGIGITRIKLAGGGLDAPRNRTNTYKLESESNTTNNRVYTYDINTIIKQGENNVSGVVVSLPQNRTYSNLFSKLQDFREIINDTTSNESKLPFTDYKVFNRETTYGESITTYKVNHKTGSDGYVDVNGSVNSDILNKLNVILSTDTQLENYKNKDLVSFYFEIINPKTSATYYLFFRAHIDSLSDSFKGDWQPYKYVGRAENFYKYSGFGRDIQMSFTVYAYSREEMIPLYDKMNRLAGATAPTYSDEGYMMGNIAKVTIGNYIKSLPGIITSVSLKPSLEAGWDLNRDNNGKLFTQVDEDKNVGQLPRLISVDLSFQPIHNFVPQYGENFIRTLDDAPSSSPNVPSNLPSTAPTVTPENPFEGNLVL
jgi:hypothetical protein